jgi:hypothetical protein
MTGAPLILLVGSNSTLAGKTAYSGEPAFDVHRP